MLHDRGKRCKRGFTLIEVLIALALSIVLAALLFSALHTYVRSATVGHDHLAAQQHAESVYEFIRDQLREAVPLVLNTNRGRNVLFHGDERKIVYVSHIPHHRSAGGLHKNALLITGTQPNQTLGFSYERLVVDDRFDHATFMTVATDPDRSLVATAAAIEFEYFGAPEARTDPRWFGKWPSEDRLPELIRIRFGKTNGLSSPDLVVPIYANAVTRHVALTVGRPAKWSLNDVIPGRTSARRQPAADAPSETPDP